jgi:meiotically up-regulated gene 157 (Mug157) protein
MAVDDPRYVATRAFALSEDNPFFFSGRAGRGIGGPHCGLGMIWPMSLIVQALTSTDEDEIVTCLRQLKATHAGTGFMHESFHQDDAARFTRPWFAWANTLFGELILTLASNRPHLLRERLP